MICGSLHILNEHLCGVARCNKKKSKVCIYINTKFANCKKNPFPPLQWCQSRYNADVKDRKVNKLEKKGGKSQANYSSKIQVK